MTKLILKNTKKIIIAGPCALESREQLRDCREKLKSLGIKIIRASLWKPRTLPGWEGLGREGLEILLEETIPYGLIPATEILNAHHAQLIVEALQQYDKDAQMIVWLGSRNQNHLEHKKIAKILAKTENIILMFKNQMWNDERHWIGIYEHFISVGFPRERLLICHRGFAPGKTPNPKKYRNLPDFEMAKRIKEKTKIQMIIDPSHIGGSRENVVEIIKKAQRYDFNGYMIEVHPDPDRAKTDAKQQLFPKQLKELLETLNLKEQKLCIK